jgi:hypothetical protein
MRTRSPITVPLDRLRVNRRLVLREPLIDQQRVQVFAERYGAEGLVAFPPIVVLDLGEDHLTVVEGHHRFFALKAVKSPEALVAPLIVEGGMPFDVALDAAIEAAVVSAKNLTRSEQRALAMRLLLERPLMSRRDVARAVGVSHTAVNTWAQGDEDGDTSRRASTDRDLQRVARRFVDAVDVLLGVALDDDNAFERTTGELLDELSDRYDDPEAWLEMLVDLAQLAQDGLRRAQ